MRQDEETIEKTGDSNTEISKSNVQIASLARSSATESSRASSQLEHMAAGLSAGLASTILLYPIDLVKTRMQVSDGISLRATDASVSGAAGRIWRSDGALGFYRGAAPAMLGASLSWGLYFYFYEHTKAQMASFGTGPRRKDGSGTATQPLAWWQHSLAAWLAGSATVLMTNPVWLVKIRLQLQDGQAQGQGSGRQYRGMADAVRSIVRDEGPLALYRGLVPALLLTSHGMVQFAAYEELKRRFAAHRESPWRPAVDFCIGAASKVAASAATFPYSVVKARLQQQGAERLYAGVVDCVRKTWRGEGLRGLYRGFLPGLARVVPSSAVTLATYEAAKPVAHALLGMGGRGEGNW